MSDRRYYSPPTSPVDDESTAINALRSRFADGGWLSTLVWNRRNAYLAWGTSEGDAMRMVVEGFLSEVAALTAENARLAKAYLRAASGEATQ